MRALVDNHLGARIGGKLGQRGRIIGQVEHVKPARPMKRVGETVTEYVWRQFCVHFF